MRGAKKKRALGEGIPVYWSIVWLLVSCIVILITLTIIESGIVRRALPEDVILSEEPQEDEALIPSEAAQIGLPVPEDIRCAVSRVTMPNENIPGFLVTVTWEPVEDAEIYEVHIIQDEGGIVLPRKFQTTECLYETGTANQAEFTFRVRAVSASEKYSPWSDPVRAKTF